MIVKTYLELGEGKMRNSESQGRGREKYSSDTHSRKRRVIKNIKFQNGMEENLLNGSSFISENR
jgi:hypothetical protein